MTPAVGRGLAGITATALVLVGGVLVGRDDSPLPLRHPDVALQAAAAHEAMAFLADYVDPSGRVVRHDQGGDTVSEGQAYAMLLAAAVDDRATFDRVWSWTTANLRRPDGLLSWHWVDGAVVDEQPAADADLDAAWALAIAEQRWPDGPYGADAAALAAAVAAHETVTVDGRTVLAAGPWSAGAVASGGDLVINPSYASPVAETVLVASELVDPRATRARAEGNRRVLAVLVDRGAPPDWALVEADGSVHAALAPDEPGGARFGWDAVRMPLRYGASCVAADVELAADVWVHLEDGTDVAGLREHPAWLVGAAGAAAAAGEEAAARELLHEATAADEARPSYYGSALDALARVLLTSDELGSCPTVTG